MSIKKQEFYEGAAIHRLAQAGAIARIQHQPPFFLLNNQLAVLLKYSTKGRSPWGFTFTVDEQLCLQRRASETETVIGLICGADGVTTLTYGAYLAIAASRGGPVHIACYREHGEHYAVSGPNGTLDKKIPPSNWRKILGESPT